MGGVRPTGIIRGIGAGTVPTGTRGIIGGPIMAGATTIPIIGAATPTPVTGAVIIPMDGDIIIIAATGAAVTGRAAITPPPPPYRPVPITGRMAPLRLRQHTVLPGRPSLREAPLREITAPQPAAATTRALRRREVPIQEVLHPLLRRRQATLRTAALLRATTPVRALPLTAVRRAAVAVAAVVVAMAVRTVRLRRAGAVPAGPAVRWAAVQAALPDQEDVNSYLINDC